MQLCSDDIEKPKGSTSSAPQAAEPKGSHDGRSAAAAESEKAKAKEVGKAKKKAKAKAHRENKQAKKREAEDKRAAMKLAQQEAEQLEMQDKKSQTLQRQERVVEEKKLALARQEAERLMSEAREKRELESQNREAEDLKLAMELSRREAERLKIIEKNERDELQRQKQEAEDEKLARREAERQKAEREDEQREAEQRGADRRQAERREVQQREVERLALDEKRKQELQRQKQAAPKIVSEHFDTKAEHEAKSTPEAPQGERATDLEPHLPVSEEQIRHTLDDTLPSRRPSNAKSLSVRVPHHATILYPSDSSPHLPSSRSESSGPSESWPVESALIFPQARRDQNAEIQQTTALRQQRIEFGADGSSSVTISPTRRISAPEREEPSGVTYPEPRQVDVQRGSSSAGAASEQHPSDIQQRQSGDAVPPRELRRVVFQLGSETSEAGTDTTTEQQLALDDRVAQRETARRISLNLGEIDVLTDSLGNSPVTPNAPPPPAVPPRMRQRVVFQLGSDTSGADSDTTAEQQFGLNNEVAQRETARRISLNLGEVDVPTESVETSAMTSNASPTPVHRAPTGEMVPVRRAGNLRKPSALGCNLVPSTVPSGRTREPRPGSPPPGLQQQQCIPDGYPVQLDPHNFQRHRGHPSQRDPQSYQHHNWYPNPTANQSFPDSSAYFDPRLHAAPPTPMPAQNDLPLMNYGRSQVQRRRDARTRDMYLNGLRDAARLQPIPQPRNDVPYTIHGRSPEQQRGRQLHDTRAMYPPAFPDAAQPQCILPPQDARIQLLSLFTVRSAPTPPQDDLPCIVDGRTPEQRREDPLPDIRVPRNRNQGVYLVEEQVLPRDNGRYLPPGPPGVQQKYRSYGAGQVPTQAVTMPGSMNAGVVPPPTAQRESRPTSRRLLIDSNLDVTGGNEHAIASSSSNTDDKKGNPEDADDESSGKDP